MVTEGELGSCAETRGKSDKKTGKAKERFPVTRIYFVRHAQPDHSWKDDITRPLTEEGKTDSKLVLDFLKDKEIHGFYSSPYKRSLDTIADSAAYFGKEILTDERLRERESGPSANNRELFEKRWRDHDYHEEKGESIRMVQERNLAALREVLEENRGRNLVVGTHGTALSAVINYYRPEFGLRDYLRILDWMPYVVELDFAGEELVGIKEHCYVEKEFKGGV